MTRDLASTLARPAFAAVEAQAVDALSAIFSGDPSGYEALFSEREEITLGNPFGPFGKGRAAVRAALANAASKYRGGDKVEVERIAAYGNADMVCLVEVERGRVRFTDREGTTDIAARVTTLFERSGDQWRLVHRHADLMPG